MEAPAGSTRNQKIVEGALLADVAVVLLLGRVYLPIPLVRTAWRFMAAAPFVLLAQRRGIKTAIMSGIVAYLLLTALVGPTLALTALDTAFAAILIAAAIHWQWPRAVTAVVAGLVYAACDIVIPTIFFAIVFRIPVTTLVADVRNGMRGSTTLAARSAAEVNRILALLFGSTGPRLPVHLIHSAGFGITAFLVSHWLVFALLVAGAMGIANIFAYHAATDLILDRLPASERAPLAAAA